MHQKAACNPAQLTWLETPRTETFCCIGVKPLQNEHRDGEEKIHEEDNTYDSNMTVFLCKVPSA